MEQPLSFLHFEKHQKREAENMRHEAQEQRHIGLSIPIGIVLITSGFGWVTGFSALALQYSGFFLSTHYLAKYTRKSAKAEGLQKLSQHMNSHDNIENSVNNLHKKTALPFVAEKLSRISSLLGLLGLYSLNILPLAGAAVPAVAAGTLLSLTFAAGVYMRRAYAEGCKDALIETGTNACITQYQPMHIQIKEITGIGFTRNLERNMTYAHIMRTPLPQKKENVLRRLFSTKAKKTTPQQAALQKKPEDKKPEIKSIDP